MTFRVRMNENEIKSYIEKVTGLLIDTRTQRCPWDRYQFTYFKLSTGVISAVRTLLDREFVNRRLFGDKTHIKDFFIEYSKGKSSKELRWFEFFIFTIKKICEKSGMTLPQIVSRLEHLSGYISGRERNPPCPPLTEAQIVWALIRRYGTSFNSFLTELQVMEEMSKRLEPYGLKIRLGTVEEDLNGVDFIIYNDEGHEWKYNLKASKYDEAKYDEGKLKEAGIKAISLSRYADTGDLQEEHYQDILRK
ncbi:MAG: hypothetical protein ACPL3B_07400, partial [Fervidobacterium sp.]